MASLHAVDTILTHTMPRKFYYNTGEEKVGPVTGQDLVRLLQEGSIQNDTWVRRAESATWRPLANIDLRQEEKKEKVRSFWSKIWESLSPAAIIGIICFLAFIIAMLFLIGSIVVKFFPFFLAMAAVWFLYRAVK